MNEEIQKTNSSSMTLVDKVSAKIDLIINFVTDVARGIVLETGRISIFAIESIRLLFAPPFRGVEILRHMEFVGNQSVGIITLSSIFTGLALSFQVYLGFKLVNAVDLVGPTVALGITRELGPVLTGLIVAARAGGAMAARLGTMRVNEQMDALDVMGVNTKQYLVAPRLLAALLCMPMLTALFDFMAMVGSWFLCTKLLGLDHAVFLSKIRDTVEIYHINEGLFKSAIFGLMFGIICTYKGFNTSGGAKGVGEATNQGVVMSMVSVIVLDYFLMNLIRIFYLITGIGR
jgi:phospholipid/cholesterol/gamma-HCH transport system permease protein